MVHEIENFYGVYLLYCLNERFKGRTYIGFTVNPNRRIKQHNKGRLHGGAWRTSGKGPWEMVLIIHGFPNMISALRFEWAWSKPQMSRRLKDLPPKKSNEKKYFYCLRILSVMLNTGPWNRLPLTIRWLKQDYQHPFPAQNQPPLHMPIVFGPVKCIKVNNNNNNNDNDDNDIIVFNECFICSLLIKDNYNEILCLKCKQSYHIICLAQSFLNNNKNNNDNNNNHLLPVEGKCLKCNSMILWGDLIRYKRGCYQDASQIQKEESSQNGSLLENDFHIWTENIEKSFCD